MKHREGIIVLGLLQEGNLDGGVTSRQVARRAVAQGYLEPPIDDKKMHEVSQCIYDLRKAGDIKIVDKNSRAYEYDFTRWGKEYYKKLKEMYNDFPPEEV